MAQFIIKGLNDFTCVACNYHTSYLVGRSDIASKWAKVVFYYNVVNPVKRCINNVLFAQQGSRVCHKGVGQFESAFNVGGSIKQKGRVLISAFKIRLSFGALRVIFYVCFKCIFDQACYRHWANPTWYRRYPSCALFRLFEIYITY